MKRLLVFLFIVLGSSLFFSNYVISGEIFVNSPELSDLKKVKNIKNKKEKRNKDGMTYDLCRSKRINYMEWFWDITF